MVSIALEAMFYYKFVKREPTKFQHLVDTLRFDHKGEYEQSGLLVEMKIVCLSFINCLINIPDKLAERAEVRSEFVRLGLREIVDVWS
jgi:hypothetical protein